MSAPRPSSWASLTLTRHALDAMRRRLVEPEDLAEVLRDPATVETAGRGPRGESRWRFTRGDLCTVVAVHPGGRAAVLTVLLRSSDRWTDADVAARPVVTL